MLTDTTALIEENIGRNVIASITCRTINFRPGNMGPKALAALEFLQQGGNKVIITDVATLSLAGKGGGGTTIYLS